MRPHIKHRVGRESCASVPNGFMKITWLILFFSACINAQIGDKDKAFEYLEKSYQERELWMAYLQVEPRLDSLRGDLRFNELVKRVALK